MLNRHQNRPGRSHKISIKQDKNKGIVFLPVRCKAPLFAEDRLPECYCEEIIIAFNAFPSPDVTFYDSIGID